MAEIKMMCDVSLESTKVCTAPLCSQDNSNSAIDISLVPGVCPNCKTTKNVIYSSASNQYTCLACNTKY